MLAYTWKVDVDWKLRLTCFNKVGIFVVINVLL